MLNIRYDPELEIATASSRRSKQWKNQKIAWSQIVGKLTDTTRTRETQAEYRKMSKDQQADIKDVGALVGGYCNDGRRTDIRFRSILALDADYAQPGLWDDWSLYYGNAAAIYSTHKHTPEKPRLRILAPLSRPVSPDEFEAIGRRVAESLGIDQFDDSTYQPQRCMFWPSTSSDGEYIFQYLDAPVLDADAVLATYTDWRDVSAWPLSSRQSEIIRKDAAKQADPLEKPGLIGAFCRAYTIEEAIEQFIPAYEPCDVPGRYTYTAGSSAAGVTVYDGKFSYSFHATDPASNMLCNAWDLVRLHCFGERDADTEPQTPMNKRPSWLAMQDKVSKDNRVKAQILQDRIGDFAEAVENTDWLSQLKVSPKDGSILPLIENIVLILEHDPELAERLYYDEMQHNIGILSPVPWRKSLGAWDDADDAALRYFLEKKYGISGKDKIFDAVNVAAMERKIHPVRDYLDSCDWDGEPRLDNMLIDYLGAEDTAYTRAVTRKALIAAVARIYHPGCKFDYMLTIRGRQGAGKSTLIRKLGGKWFSDSFSTIQGKDSYEQLQGVWIMEIGELAGMRKAEAELIKLYISKQIDRFRPAYGRRTQEFPRQCIFVGTTNETQFLRDVTGNRRFWIVDTPNKPKLDVWEELPTETIKQIWGEAVAGYKAGEDLFLSADLENQARNIQAAYEEENPKIGLISEYLSKLLPDSWADMDISARRMWLENNEDNGTEVRQTVTAIEIWAEALGCNPERVDRYAIKEINDILYGFPDWKRMGAERITVKPYGRQRYFRRINSGRE